MAPSRTKVAYILTPITFGGAEKVSLNFLRMVDRKSFDIRPVLLIRPWEEEPYFGRELRKLGYAYDTVPVAIKTDGDPLRVPRVAHRLLWILKNGSFDLIHTHGYFADICGLPVARLLGVNCISTCHGFIANDLKLKAYNLLDKYALRLSKVVIAVSENIRAELAHSGIQNFRIAVIPNAVALPCGDSEMQTRRHDKRRELAIAPSDLVVGYIGRLSEEKGLTYLVAAVAELGNTARAVKLLIVGDGPERDALEKQVKANGLERIVLFAGFQADIQNWYPVFDIFTLPSLTEGTPLALLEAMAGGVPVIASGVGGVPKIVTNGVNGLLVPPGNPMAIREKIQLLNHNYELASRLGRAGVDTVKNKYSLDNWCRAIENCYKGI